MKAIEKRLLEVLEPAGLATLLRLALGRAEMVRIANANRVSVPGMRNRSVSLERLSETLADKFVAEGPARRSILKALANAARPALPAYRRMMVEDLLALLSDPERVHADSDLSRFLFHLIAEPREGITNDQIRAAISEVRPQSGSREAGPDPGPFPDDEIQVLRREKAELSRRAAELVALVDRLRERDRRFREEAAQRKFDVNNLKLQMNKLKKERDSLEKDVRALAGKLDQMDRRPPSAADLGDKLATNLAETRRLASSFEKLQARLASPREEKSQAVAAPTARALEDLRRDAQVGRKEIEVQYSRIAKLTEENAVRLTEIAAALGETAGEEPPRKGGPERVGVFVDVQNMFYAARGQNARLDFDVLLQTTTRGRRLIRALAYVVEAREIDQSGFIALLQQKRYEVKRKDLKVRSDGSFKGDWDMEIALDALEMAPLLDVVVLVTGDGDFTGLVQKLKMIGPRVEVYSFPRNTAKELREAADRFVPIDKRMLIKMPEGAKPAPKPTGTAGS